MSILTGFTELDNITGGLNPGELTVVAGRPSMGKSTLCWSVADKIKQRGGKVCIAAVKLGYVGTDNPFGIVTYQTGPLDNFDNILNTKYDVIFYTALLPTSNKEAAHIYGKLKTLAVEKDIAIVIEAGVDRKVERLENRRPKLEHIKHFSTLDKYADNVLIVYRHCYYNAQADMSLFEVNVAKSSSGRCGTAILKFEIDDIPTTIRIPRIINFKENDILI